MRVVTGIFKSLLLLCFLVAAFEGVHAQTARTFGDKNIIVRLCPEKCTPVTGHGFKPKSKTTVFETRDGWARVSAFLDRARLVPTFGNDIPQKPALWVPVNSLAPRAAAQAAAKKVAERSKPARRAASNDKKVTLPSFRPGTVFASAPSEPEVPTQPTQVATQPNVLETPAPASAADPVQSSLPPGAVRREDGTVVLREVVRVEDGKPKGDGARKTLTWAEVQERIRQKAAQAGKEAKTQRVVRDAKPVVAVISAEERKAQDEAIERARKAREAAEAERKRQADEAAKANIEGGVAYAPPKAEEPKQPETQVAAVQPEQDQTFAAATPDPISIGARPKTFTRALADKRLSKLPGPKSRVRKDVVIALRHMGLTLLKNGICKGIAGGGPSTTPGMLYVTCTDDPTYLHQFPLEEVSW